MMAKEKEKNKQDEFKKDIIQRSIPFSSINPSDEGQESEHIQDLNKKPKGEAADKHGGNSIGKE